MSSVSIAECRKLFPIKREIKSAVQQSKLPDNQSVGEVVLATHLRACKIGFEQEYEFHPERKVESRFFNKGFKDFD